MIDGADPRAKSGVMYSQSGHCSGQPIGRRVVSTLCPAMIVAMAAGAPVAALDFGQAAQIMCIDPFEAVTAPDASGLVEVEPVPRFILTGDRVYALGQGFLVLSGDFASEASRCEVYADATFVTGPSAESWFKHWSGTAKADGRYLWIDGALESDDWREPRMRVAFEITNGIAHLMVEDTDKEA